MPDPRLSQLHHASRRRNSLWSLLIMVSVAAVIWTGYWSQATKTLEVTDSPTKAADPAITLGEDPDAELPPVYEVGALPRENARTWSPVPEYSMPAPTYYVPGIGIGDPHVSSIADLPDRGWIREPLVTPDWIRSFTRYCLYVARRTEVDCYLQANMLERLRAKPGELSDPWVQRIIEQLGYALDIRSGELGLAAFNIACGREGCLIFLAASPYANWPKINESLVGILTDGPWSSELSLRSEPPFGGIYADGSGTWDVMAIERLGPLPEPSASPPAVP
ncbi:MAG TPA: hypothetical protein VJN00_06935 [Steroidobacteraceae bacterium]|jgi:hypothetical protein|nr:hypothetical protein [Steroidobacteraceae bacterium]